MRFRTSVAFIGVLLLATGSTGWSQPPAKETPLTVEQARELVAKSQSLRSFLMLNSVSTLTPEIAAELAGAKGQLSLDGRSGRVTLPKEKPCVAGRGVPIRGAAGHVKL